MWATPHVIDEPFEEPASQPQAETDAIRSYLSQASRVPLLSAVEEHELFRQIDEARKARNTRRLAALKQRAIEANLRLVISVAKRYRYSNVPLLDRIQDGNLGLIDAIDRFDYRRGFKFSTYAVWWIRRSILRGMSSTARTVRLPSQVVAALNRIGTSKAAFIRECGREPTIDELAARTGMPPDKIVATLTAGLPPVTLDGVVGEDTPFAAFVADLQTPPPDAVLCDGDDHRWMRQLLDSLPPRERQVLEWRFGLGGEAPVTLDVVGRRLGLSRERVRQIEKVALGRLRSRWRPQAA